MAEHPVESAPLGYVSTAKQATFQVAPRCVGQFLTLRLALIVTPSLANLAQFTSGKVAVHLQPMLGRCFLPGETGTLSNAAPVSDHIAEGRMPLDHSLRT